MRSFRSLPPLVREQGPLLFLLVVLAGLWLAQEFGPQGWDRPFMVVPADVLASVRGVLDRTFSAADLGPLSTLVTHAFLHGDLLHLVYNALYLWLFGALIVEHLGQRLFGLIFFGAAIIGGATQVALNPNDLIPMLGASGAVMGFEGAYLGLALRFQLRDPHVWPMAHPIPPAQLAALAVVGLVFDLHGVFAGGERIAYGAHIGGLLAGFTLTALLIPARALRP